MSSIPQIRTVRTVRGESESQSRTFVPMTAAAECTTALVAEADPSGRQVEHRRVRDDLDKLLEGGVITGEMYEAGRRWQRDFIIGTLHAMPLSRLAWVPGGTGAACLTDRQCDARRRLAAAVAALGGYGAASTDAVWHVLGMGMSAHEYATRQGWRGLKMERRMALGILVAALAVLAGHYEIG